MHKPESAGDAGYSDMNEENSGFDMEELIAELSKTGADPVKGEPMSLHTSFRIGGPALLYLRVSSAAQLGQVLEILNRFSFPYFILGRGTNILAADAGIRRAVISMTEGSRGDLSEIRAAEEMAAGDGETVYVEAGAGVTLARLASFARDRGLTGLEFAAGIPGSVGGALVMNAGAYGGEMKQVVASVRMMLPDGSIRTASGEEMRFGYRTSCLKETDKTAAKGSTAAIALSAVFELKKADPSQITRVMQELAVKRMEKQPLEYPSAGSTFKRPEGYFAGKLIMDAGLAGYSVGGAQVSEKHCGFVINRGGATAADVKQVMSDVAQKVLLSSGVVLEPEVIMVE